MLNELALFHRSSTARKKLELYFHCHIRTRARHWREHRDLRWLTQCCSPLHPDTNESIMLAERSHIFDNGAVGYMNWLDWHAGRRSY